MKGYRHRGASRLHDAWDSGAAWMGGRYSFASIVQMFEAIGIRPLFGSLGWAALHTSTYLSLDSVWIELTGY